MDGIKESFSDLWTAARKVLFGYTEEEAAAVKENLEQAQENVVENETENGYYNPLEAMAGTTISDSALIVFAGIILLLFVIRD